VVYFGIFNWGSLRVHFALDDIANMGHYYEYSPWQVLLSNLLPWRGDSRPMGGLFYMPIYHFAGLNPVPYQAVLLLIVLANVYFVYRFARELGASELAAALAAFVSCYHGGIGNLYYNAAFVFDALCSLFFLAAFVYYLRIRNRGELLNARQTIFFLLLFLGALDSKEMAVTIPILLVIYEWIYHRPDNWSVAALVAWVRGPARVAWIAAVLNALDIYPKISGPTAMTAAFSYRPEFTTARLHKFWVEALRDLLCSWAWTPGPRDFLLICLALAVLAWWNFRRPILPFLFWYLVVVPFPIEFLMGKAQACLTLIMVGGVIFLAVVFADAVEWLAPRLARIFGLPESDRRRIAAVMIGITLFFWVKRQSYIRDMTGGPPMTTLGFETWDLIQQLTASDYRPKPGTMVVFTEDPFPETYDMYFLVGLWLHDRSVKVHVTRLGPLPDSELAKADAIFAIHDRKLQRLK
jgi:hypothetical protein